MPLLINRIQAIYKTADASATFIAAMFEGEDKLRAARGKFTGGP